MENFWNNFEIDGQTQNMILQIKHSSQQSNTWYELYYVAQLEWFSNKNQ